MIRIAGSFGEGGGQILRTSLSLSLAAGAAAPASDLGLGGRRSGRRGGGGRHPRVCGPDPCLARTFLPLLERTGPTLRLQFERYGFCPAGGGRSCAEIEQTRNSGRPGNVVPAEIGTVAVAEILSAFGQLGVNAGKVASPAVRDARQYPISQAAAGEHPTDQLPLPLGLAGTGPFTAEKIDLHARTNRTVISGQSAFRGSRRDRGYGATGLSSQLGGWLPGMDSNHE